MALEFTRVGLSPHYVEYSAGWDLQQQLHRQVREGKAPNTVLLLEHTPVYTAGRRTEPHERPFDGTEVVNVDRGGKLTWHGPGQLVGYPILKLADPARVLAYVDALEAAVISVLQDYKIPGVRVEGRSGVWIRGDGQPFGRPDRKIAAVGIRVHEGVTMHGFSLNCSNDLAPYSQIIACGISDAGTTSISVETGQAVSPADVVARVEDELAAREADLTGTTPSKNFPGIGAVPAGGRPKGALL
ncbi:MULTISPECIES: lipoyl(octanoyl) transferase LipB [unclassified Arthrobacter]|uniref:lipoyl(octanoyl) transferase LipB n=1 Tax=unclassified Arthrobacter TaxID=235627 RepID=UPI00210264B4|nr:MULTISPECIES: lipoyl(octanoyl) transferase LipB [unclassified Arthrobacter]MCQ1987247.1 lipoyl(octanoyl) transferase LipB [Arthrobacter sp. zg-Y844]MCQ1995910.1 lipoyl(octanoyl) transferase LipB [Arthrobacter sp. zg-Y1171]UWX83011.1 lipoyl(octanoyl) transferase LipB [Arthrobacter sp. zg-Y1171]